MKVLTSHQGDALPADRSRIDLICSVFEGGFPSFLSLENCLDAIERDEWSGIWW